MLLCSSNRIHIFHLLFSPLNRLSYLLYMLFSFSFILLLGLNSGYIPNIPSNSIPKKNVLPKMHLIIHIRSVYYVFTHRWMRLCWFESTSPCAGANPHGCFLLTGKTWEKWAEQISHTRRPQEEKKIYIYITGWRLFFQFSLWVLSWNFVKKVDKKTKLTKFRE